MHRRLVILLTTLGMLVGPLCGSALAHAVLLSATPADGATLQTPPRTVTLRFSEPITILQGSDAEVLDGRRRTVSTAARLATGNTRAVEIPLSGRIPPGSYTVRYRLLSADAHVITGVTVFAVGNAALAAPVSAGGEGPSETGPWAVSARLLELIGLGGLFGLIAYRLLVWRPSITGVVRRDLDGTRAAAAWMRDSYWLAFSILALGSIGAEVYLLLTKSASLLGTSVPAAFNDPAGVIRTLSDSRFGELLQTRSVLLLILFGAGLALTSWEAATDGDPLSHPAGRLIPTMLMAAASIAALVTISAQGHASTAPVRLLSMTADTIHLAAAALWIVGLAFTTATLIRLPRVAPEAGRALAAATLARFSRVALIAVTAVVLTGVLRSAAQLSAPAQLWDTAYGRSILIKAGLLVPVAAIALRNRKIATTVAPRRWINRGTSRIVSRGTGLELALAVSILVVASILVAQVPGRAGG